MMLSKLFLTTLLTFTSTLTFINSVNANPANSSNLTQENNPSTISHNSTNTGDAANLEIQSSSNNLNVLNLSDLIVIKPQEESNLPSFPWRNMVVGIPIPPEGEVQLCSPNANTSTVSIGLCFGL